MRQRGCLACCLRNQYPVPVRRCPESPLCSLLSWQGLAASTAQNAGSLQQGKSLVNQCWVQESVAQPQPGSLPLPFRPLLCCTLFFLRHKHKMELAGSKNNLSKMAECSRECQAIKQRERAPPAVQQRDPRFLSSLFLNRWKESILQSPS